MHSGSGMINVQATLLSSVKVLLDFLQTASGTLSEHAWRDPKAQAGVTKQLPEVVESARVHHVLTTIKLVVLKASPKSRKFHLKVFSSVSGNYMLIRYF